MSFYWFIHLYCASTNESSLSGNLRSTVELQLCPPLQFGPLTYQPIECVFISSNQSALWSCLRHLTSQLGEGCSMSFVRFVLLIRWKTCAWNSSDGFLENLQKREVCIPANLRRSKIWRLSFLHYTHPPFHPRMSTAPTTPPPPTRARAKDIIWRLTWSTWNQNGLSSM